MSKSDTRSPQHTTSATSYSNSYSESPPTDNKNKNLQVTEVTRIIKFYGKCTCKLKCHPSVKYYTEQNNSAVAQMD